MACDKCGEHNCCCGTRRAIRDKGFDQGFAAGRAEAFRLAATRLFAEGFQNQAEIMKEMAREAEGGGDG